jgi:hypothetical protein
MEKRNNWEDEFVPYDLAIRLKNIGFDEVCFMYFKEDMDGTPVPFFFDEGRFPDIIGSSNSDGVKWILCTRPTFSQSFRWFRDNYRLAHYILPPYSSTHKGLKVYQNIENKFELYLSDETQLTLKDQEFLHETYEAAERVGLEKLISLVEQQLEDNQVPKNTIGIRSEIYKRILERK